MRCTHTEFWDIVAAIPEITVGTYDVGKSEATARVFELRLSSKLLDLCVGLCQRRQRGLRACCNDFHTLRSRSSVRRMEPTYVEPPPLDCNTRRN
eukprot:COSAG02_NODE_21049_length_805_cov_0.660057_1_plen_94_part_01